MSEHHGEPVTITLNHTAALLLARLAVELAPEPGREDPQGVVLRALGLLEMAQRHKRRGGRLVFVNERGEQADVVF